MGAWNSSEQDNNYDGSSQQRNHESSQTTVNSDGQEDNNTAENSHALFSTIATNGGLNGIMSLNRTLNPFPPLPLPSVYNDLQPNRTNLRTLDDCIPHPIDPLLSMAPTDPFLHSRRDIANDTVSSHQPNQTTSSSQNEIVEALGGNQASFPATLYTSNQITLYNHIIHIQQNPQIQILLLQKYHFPFDLLSALLNLASIHSLLLSPAGVRCLKVDKALTEEILTTCENLIQWYK